MATLVRQTKPRFVRGLRNSRKITAHPPSGTNTNILEFTDGSPLPGIKRHGADLAPCLLLAVADTLPLAYECSLWR